MARDPEQTRRTALALAALAASLVLAVGAVYAVVVVVDAYQVLLRDTEEAHAERLILVPVANKILGVGTVLTNEDLDMVDLAVDYVAPTAITQKEDLVGRTIVERLLPGDLVRLERLAPPEAGQGLSALVPGGMRALSLDLSDGQQVSGFIEPGDGVDLLVTLPVDKQEARLSETVTLVQAAKVLAVGEKISETVRGEKIRRPRVTLAISPDLVERITHALEIGEPKLTLRSSIDMTHSETHGAVVSDMLGLESERVTVSQFRERYSEEDVAKMIDIVMGKDKVRERVIDPRLIRPPPGVTHAPPPALPTPAPAGG